MNVSASLHGVMPPAEKPVQDESMAELADVLTTASDGKLLDILSIIDALPHRGRADALIAPSRARLAELAPTRPLTARRLMFMPFDAVIVPTANWRPLSGTIPRGLIRPTFDALQPHIADLAAREAQIEAIPSGDLSAIDHAGQPLWAVAAAHVEALRTSGDDWRPAGLDEASLAELLAAMAVIFRNMPRLDPLALLAGATVPLEDLVTARRTLIAMLDVAARSGPEPWALMLGMLLEPERGYLSRAPVALLRHTIDMATYRAAAERSAERRGLLERVVEESVARLVARFEPLIEEDVLQGTMSRRWSIGRLGRAASVLSDLTSCGAISVDQSIRVLDLNDAVHATARRKLEQAVQAVLDLCALSAETVPTMSELEAAQEAAAAVRQLAVWVPEGMEAVAGLAEPWTCACAVLLARLQPPSSEEQASGSGGRQAGPSPLDPQVVALLRIGELALGSRVVIGLAATAGCRL